VAYRLEEELAATLGIEGFKTSALTSSIAIEFNPRVLTAERLVRQLEKSWPRLLEGLDGPPSGKRLVAAGGLLGLAFTGQYLLPSLRPLAVLGVAIYGLPNVMNGAKQLVQWQVGLPALYSVGLTFMLLSGMPFSSAVMALLMQFWPRLAFQTMIASQRRLFASHRHRATWARIVRDDGLETEIDIDALKAGDLISIHHGETIPVDGVVTAGLATVDEEALTGTAGAVDKTASDTVYSTTFVRDGRLTVRVEKLGLDTVAGHIGVQLPHARLSQLPSLAEAERIANRNAKPALALAGVSLLATRLARPSQAIIRPDYATAPRLSAQLTALHNLADGLHQGIFFRDPAALDRLPATDIYVFDDVYALERKQIEVADISSSGIVSADAVLAYATAPFPASQNERARALHAQCLKQHSSIAGIFKRTRHAGVIRYRDGDNRLLEIAAPAYVRNAGIVVPRLRRRLRLLRLHGSVTVKAAEASPSHT
jgi:cation transport ATPase